MYWHRADIGVFPTQCSFKFKPQHALTFCSCKGQNHNCWKRGAIGYTVFLVYNPTMWVLATLHSRALQPWHDVTPASVSKQLSFVQHICNSSTSCFSFHPESWRNPHELEVAWLVNEATAGTRTYVIGTLPKLYVQSAVPIIWGHGREYLNHFVTVLNRTHQGDEPPHHVAALNYKLHTRSANTREQLHRMAVWRPVLCPQRLSGNTGVHPLKVSPLRHPTCRTFETHWEWHNLKSYREYHGPTHLASWPCKTLKESTQGNTWIPEGNQLQLLPVAVCCTNSPFCLLPSWHLTARGKR